MAQQQALAVWCVLLMAAAGATAFTPTTQPRNLAGRRLQNVLVRTPRTFNSDTQAAVNLEAADATEQAINAAAGGDIDAGTATFVGSVTASEAAQYGQYQGTRYGDSHWTTGRRMAAAHMPPTQLKNNLAGRRLKNALVRTPGTFNSDTQAAINLEAADATEQAINAAADGEIDAGTAAFVGSVTANEAAQYGQYQGTRNGDRHWTTGRR